MRLADLLAAITGAITDLLKRVKITDWRWERGNVGGAVDQAALHLLPGDVGLHAEFRFTEAGQARVLTAEREFLSKRATVTLDGAPVVGGDVTLAKHLHLWPPAVIVEIDVDVPNASLGAQSRYKFTGHVT